MLDGLAAEHGARLPFRTTTDLVDAVEGTDFVFCAIRVGQLEGRVVDEDVPLGMGVLGQETTGPGGICFALRTIPVMVRLAETIAKHAPERLADQLHQPGGDGHRGRPAGARRPRRGHLRLAFRSVPARGGRAGPRPAASSGSTTSASTTWAGCAASATPAARALLDGLLDDDAQPARLRGGPPVRRRVAALAGDDPERVPLLLLLRGRHGQRDPRSGSPRGAFLLEQQRAFYARSDGDALADWRATRHDRERTYMAEARSAAGDESEHDHDANAGYESEAMAVLEAIALNSRQVLILNTANRSSLPFLDERAVVEVPCVVGRAGPVPLAIGQVPAHARALVETMKDVERTTIDAALLGSRELAVKALALHPLVPSVTTARAIFDGYRERLPALQEASRDAPTGVDIACAEPAFLDLTMTGLDKLPGLGEERLATDFLRSPGGGAITAVGAARLGSVERARLAAGRRRGRDPAALAARRRRRALERAARRALARDRDHAAGRRSRDGDLRPGGGRDRRRARRRRAARGRPVDPPLRPRSGGRARVRLDRRRRRARARRRRAAAELLSTRACAAGQRARGASC